MAVPEAVLTNDDMAAIVETNDEWIRSRTGIRERHIAGEKETTATLGLKAAQKALEVADVLPAELNLIIVATSTAENIFPSSASLIQAWLGASKAGAFDLSAACSGFVYGVQMAAQAIRSGSAKTALIIGAETMSRVVDWQDRGTCILFGDGAGAIVLQASETEGGVLSAIMRSDGQGSDLLGLPSYGSSGVELADGHKMGKMFMNGGEVFKFASRVFASSVTEAVEDAGLAIADIELIIPHQANARITAAAARALKLDESKLMSNIDRYGNTSAASIPIALCEAIQQGRVKQNDHIVLVGFGGGLAWASMVIKWGVDRNPERPSGNVINRTRRQIIYTLASWQARFNRWSRRFDAMMRRAAPNSGRMERLRHKVENTDDES
jgi:3-oxoacyl-[acyl-carrier-protein] synthase-3